MITIFDLLILDIMYDFFIPFEKNYTSKYWCLPVPISLFCNINNELKSIQIFFFKEPNWNKHHLNYKGSKPW